MFDQEFIQDTLTYRFFLTLEKKNPRQAEFFWHSLSFSERVRLVLTAQGADRERLIILAQDSRKLTESLAPDDFSRTILELGPEDAGNLLALASNRQLIFFFTLISWVQDKFIPSRYIVWLAVLLEAGSKQVERLLKNIILEILVLFFAYWIKVVKYLPDQDVQEEPNDLPEFTLDGVYFIEFRDQSWAELIIQILILLKDRSSNRYYELMEAILWEPRTNLVEDALNWRRGYMQDFGFPHYLESLELWARPKVRETDWINLPSKLDMGYFVNAHQRSNKIFLSLFPDYSLPILVKTLDKSIVNIFRTELAYIANCAVVALGVDVANFEDVDKAGREGLGLVNLGLEILAEEYPGKEAAIIERLPLSNLARQGVMAIRSLHRRALKILQDGWLADMPTGLNLLDSPLNYWLVGLLYKYPRCYDPKKIQYQEFRGFINLRDLTKARYYLTQIEFLETLLFDLMDISRQEFLNLFKNKVWPKDYRQIKISTIVGTWLARQGIGLSGLMPIPFNRLQESVIILQNGLKENLFLELVNSYHLLNNSVDAILVKDILDNIFIKLNEELVSLNVLEEIDPRFIHGIVIER